MSSGSVKFLCNVRRSLVQFFAESWTSDGSLVQKRGLTILLPKTALIVRLSNNHQIRFEALLLNFSVFSYFIPTSYLLELLIHQITIK